MATEPQIQQVSETGSGIDILSPEDKLKAEKAMRELRAMEYQAVGDLMNRLDVLYKQHVAKLDDQIAQVQQVVKEVVKLMEVLTAEVEIQMEVTEALGVQLIVEADKTMMRPMPVRPG